MELLNLKIIIVLNWYSRLYLFPKQPFVKVKRIWRWCWMNTQRVKRSCPMEADFSNTLYCYYPFSRPEVSETDRNLPHWSILPWNSSTFYTRTTPWNPLTSGQDSLILSANRDIFCHLIFQIRITLNWVHSITSKPNFNHSYDLILQTE